MDLASPMLTQIPLRREANASLMLKVCHTASQHPSCKVPSEAERLPFSTCRRDFLQRRHPSLKISDKDVDEYQLDLSIQLPYHLLIDERIEQTKIIQDVETRRDRTARSRQSTPTLIL